MELLPLGQSHELHAHGIATRLADLTDTGADHLTTASDEHEFVVLGDGEGPDHEAGLVTGLHRDDTFAAA